ncbi:hypothetical protein E2C01_095339 [Portunus trituberculatus]|uniref:Uncharacterized protein n=1 Tax=Portunus trituberculatus TaxID=210409 RepID=A0A5B7K5I2_PORTR|nr:hypothetical protein [Portunus trituberculatus]
MWWIGRPQSPTWQL